MTTVILPANDWIAVYWEEAKPNGQGDQVAFLFSRMVYFQITIQGGDDPQVSGYDALDGRINEPCEAAANHLGYIHVADRHNPAILNVLRERAMRMRAAEE